jgi:S-adenosylmethionine:diacylglycerol 3-amino-3-carboxypropyl transferase
MSLSAQETVWARGRFGPSTGPKAVLFGRMYEDASIELAAFRPGGRIFCIASAGCTAFRLAPRCEVVAVDVNPAQLAYAERRIAGEPMLRGTAERLMSLGRPLLPLAGWRPSRLRAFLDLERPAVQAEYWRRHLDTRRLRAALDILFSRPLLRAAYAAPLLACLPPRFGAVVRARMERCFATHPNRTNPYARALLLGELCDEPVPSDAGRIHLVHADAAAYLEAVPGESFDGFTLSNILDGAENSYRARLLAAVKRSAAPDAIVVLRSFGEPPAGLPTNRAAEDRAMLWGIVDVKPTASL